MHLTVGVAVLLQAVLTLAQGQEELLSDLPRTEQPKPIGCMDMTRSPGTYTFTSEGSTAVCAFFIAGMPHELPVFEFEHFDIDCQKGGRMEIFDGWVIHWQPFPSTADHPLPLEERYRVACGKLRPTKAYIASQNVAMLHFRAPKAGQGFRLRLRFIPNRRPCNVVTLQEEGTYTLHNYGRKTNCSLSIISPQAIIFLNLDVGVTSEAPGQLRETGTIHQCVKRQGTDYVELRNGDTLDTDAMTHVTDVCGLDSAPASDQHLLPCKNTVVRLVSSGRFYNSVTFAFRRPSNDELMTSDMDVCTRQ